MTRKIRTMATATTAFVALFMTLGLLVGPAASGSRPYPVNCQLWLNHPSDIESVSPQWIDPVGITLSAADAADMDLFADANNEALSAQFVIDGVEYPIENEDAPSTDPACVHSFSPPGPLEMSPGTHVVQVTLWSGLNGTGVGTIDRYIVTVEYPRLLLPGGIDLDDGLDLTPTFDCTPFCLSLG